jgi:hypothetical protein
MKAGFWEEIRYQALHNINRDIRSESNFLRVMCDDKWMRLDLNCREKDRGLSQCHFSNRQSRTDRVSAVTVSRPPEPAHSPSMSHTRRLIA